MDDSHQEQQRLAHERREAEKLEQQREQRRLQRLAQKKRRLLQQRIVLALLALILVLAIVLVVRGCRKSEPKPQLPTQQEQTQLPGEELVVPADPLAPLEDTVVHLGAVGDIMVYEEQLELALQPDGSYNFADSFSAVSALTLSPDLMVGNLELTLCGEPYEGKPGFRIPVALAQSLRDAGFDILQTANTNSITNGISGLESTISALESVGIDHLGTYASAEERAANEGVLLKTVNGIKIAFIGFTKGVNNLSLPAGSEYAVNLLYEDYYTEYTTVAEKVIEKALNAAEALKPDITVAMLHWGTEWDAAPGDTQDEILELMLDGGVDVILGTHPHVAGKLEVRQVEGEDGETRPCLIAYSLGNFLASPDAQTRAHTMQSLLLDVEITKDGETGATGITNISYTPLYIAKTGEGEAEQIQILPVRNAIKSELFPELTEDLTATIAHLRSATESDLDSGK